MTDEATEPIVTEGNRNPMGVVGLILSCLGLVVCVFSVPGLVVSLIAMRRRPRGAATAGVVVGSIASFLALLLIPLLLGMLLPALSQARVEAEKVRLNRLHQTLSTPGANLDPEGVRTSIGNDSWNTPYQVRGDGTSVPKISSAGPDRFHGTEDDVHPDADHDASDGADKAGG